MKISGAAGSGPPSRPMLAPGVVLAGPMPGTAYQNQQWLIQRADRYLQVSEILYRVAELSDGTRTEEEIAVLVSAATRRNVTADDVQAVVTSKLGPAGIVASTADVPLTAAPSSSPLGVQLGTKVIGPAAIDAVARIAQIFFFPGVAIVAFAASIGAHLWLYREHDLTPALQSVVLEPWRMVALGAIVVAAAAFHELGHATGLRVAGGRARGMGFGFYLVYPVLYTDVTDSYRLGRWRRLLTDVGGFYFNLIFALGVFGAYAVYREEWLLVAVAMIDFEILHQLLPLGRLDGYWILADLTGVPDFFAIGGPFARRAAGARSPLPALRPVANVVVALYLLLIVPAFALLAYLVARAAPRLVAATLEAFLVQAGRFEQARATQDLWSGIAAVGQGMILLLPVLGVALFLLGMGRWVARGLAKLAGKTPGQRIATATSAAAAVLLLVALWAPVSAAVAPRANPAVEFAETRLRDSLDPAPTSAPAEPASSQPRALPAPTQNGLVTAPPVRLVSPMPRSSTPMPIPTPSAAPSAEPTASPVPTVVPSPASPSVSPTPRATP